MGVNLDLAVNAFGLCGVWDVHKIIKFGLR